MDEGLGSQHTRLCPKPRTNMRENTVEETDWFGYLLGGIATVISTLAAAVFTLWNRSEQKNAHSIEILTTRSEKCEEDRVELRIEVHDLHQEVDAMGKRIKELEK